MWVWWEERVSHAERVCRYNDCEVVLVRCVVLLIGCWYGIARYYHRVC